MPAQWSPKRWPKKAVAELEVAPPPPPPPAPVEEKWMARFNNSYFYFTAMTPDAAVTKACVHFRNVMIVPGVGRVGTPHVQLLDTVPC